jgi:Pilus formation protein N terminal region
MRAAVTFLLLAAAAPAAAGTPLALAERQVVSLEFDRPVARVTVTDPDLVAARSAGPGLTVTALKGGRATLEVAFADGASVVYDVAVEGARRPAARPAGANDLDVAVAEERSFRAPGVERVLVEENGVARVSVRGETVSVVGLAPGQASLVVVHTAGEKTTWQIRVR